MAEIIYPSKASYQGPWLIDYDKLQTLDQVVKNVWELLLKQRDTIIDKHVDRELDSKIPAAKKNQERRKIRKRIENIYPFNKESRDLIIYLKKRKSIRSSTIEEAAKEPGINDELPIGFYLDLECYDAKVTLSLGRSSYIRDEMELSVEAADPSVERDILFQLKQWIDSVRAPYWQRLWKKINGYHWFLLVAILFTSPILLSVIPTERQEYSKILKSEARQILEEGITQEEISRALEIILSLNTDYIPSGFEGVDYPWLRWFIWFFLISLPVAIIISFPPKVYLGMGLGIGKIRKWSIWLRILSIIIPSAILLPFIINIVTSKLL